MDTDQRLSAWELYESEARHRPLCRTPEVVCNYFLKLRGAVYRELTAQGRCELIERLYDGRWPENRKYPVLVTVAVAQVLEALNEGYPLPNITDFSTVVRSFGWRLDFAGQDIRDDMMYMLSVKRNTILSMQRIYDSVQRSFLRSKATAGPEKQMQQKETPAPQGQAAQPSPDPGEEQQSLEAAERKAKTILEEARQTSERIVEEAKRKAEVILRYIRQDLPAKAVEELCRESDRLVAGLNPPEKADAQTILQEVAVDEAVIMPAVKQEVRRVLNAADHCAKVMQDEANANAGQIWQNALEQEQQILAGAREKAGQILAEAKEQAALEAKQESERIVQRELKAHFRQQRQDLETELAEDAARRADISSLGAKLKEAACSETTAFSATLNATMEGMERQMERYRNDVVTGLSAWQQSLYKCEFASLIEVYSLMRSQVNRFENDAVKAQTASPEELREMLMKHSTSVSRLWRNLIRAMETMGLRQYVPQAGETFDSYYHTVNDNEDDDAYNDRIIAGCVAAGVERVVNTKESAVILRATVELEPEAPEYADPSDGFGGRKEWS